MIMRKSILMILFASAFAAGNAQITILNTNLNSMNVTPQSLCQVSIMNGSGAETQAVLEAKLMNNAGENILTVKTMPFSLAAGMNNGISLNYSIETNQYGINGQAEYVRNTHILPSGNFKYCVSVVALPEGEGDDLCEDIVSDISSFLTLVYPNDMDTLETVNPVLTWSHSEPFNILSPGDHFKIVVVELNNDQSAEAGIQVNLPVYFKDFVAAHQVPYPYDAKNLQEGRRYGWQVQKISNGTIIDKTEAWEFTIRKNILTPDNKYTTLKKKADGTVYYAANEKIFFRFTEDHPGGDLRLKILNSKLEEITPEAKNDKTEHSITAKSGGANYYEIDLSSMNLKKGFYELQVFDAKNEKYILKFKVD